MFDSNKGSISDYVKNTPASKEPQHYKTLEETELDKELLIIDNVGSFYIFYNFYDPILIIGFLFE